MSVNMEDYLVPTDPPVPFPQLTTFEGENTVDVDTTVQPEKTVLTYRNWDVLRHPYVRSGGEWTQEPDTLIYGWHVDPSISDPANAVTYLADAVGKTPAGMRSGVTSTLELEQGGIIVDEQTGATIKNPTILSTRVRTTQLNIPIPWTRQLTLNCSNTRIRYLITWLDDDDIEVGTHQWDSETTTYNAPDDATSFNVLFMLDNGGSLTPSSVGTATYSYETAFSYGDWADAFFMPKPCMLRYDGTVAYYLDPDDYTKKADGTASDVANSSYGGNAMMEWPLIWYKFEAGTTEGEGYFYVSNKKVDSTYHCWCNYDANDNVIEHFYTAIYNGTGTSKMRSLSGVRLTSANGNGGTTGQQEVDRAIANNTTQTVEWYTDVLSDRLLINALMILMSKSLDDQTAFGRGLDSGSQSAKEAYVTGSLNDKGLFWGVTSAGSSGVKIFGMENWYGCCWHRTAGMVGTSSGYRIKLTYGTIDGSTASGYSSTGTGYLAVSNRPTTSDYVSKMQFNDKGFFPKVVGGSSSTYWAEFFYAGNGYALFGSYTNGGLGVGSSYVALNYGFGVSGWSFSASLSCKPISQS